MSRRTVNEDVPVGRRVCDSCNDPETDLLLLPLRPSSIDKESDTKCVAFDDDGLIEFDLTSSFSSRRLIEAMSLRLTEDFGEVEDREDDNVTVLPDKVSVKIFFSWGTASLLKICEALLVMERVDERRRMELLPWSVVVVGSTEALECGLFVPEGLDE